MRRYGIKRITADVALLTGLDPELAGAVTESEYPTLERRVEAEVEECAAEAVQGLPRGAIEGWRLLPDDGLTIGEEGEAVVPLPSDFLRLHSVRMSDWESEVTKIYAADHWLAGLQGRGFPALRGSPTRPLAFEGLDRNGKRALRMYSSKPGSTLASGWYLPAPKLDAKGEIELPEGAYRPMVRLIAARISERTLEPHLAEDAV